MRQVILLGRAGGDGELRYTPQGTPVFNFSIAVSEKRADATETHWFDVVVWSKSAEIAKEQIRKGCEVLVIGNLQSRSYTDKDNRKITKVDVSAMRLRVTQYKRDESNKPPAPSKPDTQPDFDSSVQYPGSLGGSNLGEDDIPF